MILSLVCAAALAAPVQSIQATRIAPGHYVAVQGGTTADLRLLPIEHSLVFHTTAARGGASLQQQAALLRVLLPTMLADGHPAVLNFLPQPNDALVDRLAGNATHDPTWDAARGAPRGGGGTLRVYLLHALNKSEVGGPFADVFAAAGYRLRAVTAAGVMTGPRLGVSGRVPTFINEIGFEARAVPAGNRR